MKQEKKRNQTFEGIINNMLRWQTLLATIAIAMTLCACSDDDATPWQPATQNKAALITDQEKLTMLRSMVDLEGNKGRIYEMRYTADYKLDEALNAGIDGTNSLIAFVAQHLMDVMPQQKSLALSFDAGCSAFACTDASTGNRLMGRNFDFNHLDPDTKERIMIPMIAVHTAPAGGKKSVSFVDGQFLNYKSGFYTDGTSDLSMLMALPYVPLDGMNEDGFAVSVLKLDGDYTQQEEVGKKKIFTTVAMRMLLDKAGSVDEAIELLEQYNMCSDKVQASYHFFLADAKGDYAIVEYTADPNGSSKPHKMEVLKDNDAYRYVTNFYVAPSMADTEHGINHSQHGMARYETLRNKLQEMNYRLTPTQGMELLKAVAQGPENPELSTGFTQWSEMYNLSKKTVTLSILREFDRTFVLGIQ